MEPDFYARYFELEDRHWWFLGRRAIFLATLERYAPADAGRALDFGCGTGTWLAHLERFAPVAGVDGDEAAVAFCHARGRHEVRHLPAGEVLPFDDESFDIVTALDVVEHIEDDAAALAELRRVLRPGGIVLIAVPAFPMLWGDQDEISHHFRRYRRPELRRRVQAAGLSIRHASYFNTLLFAPVAGVRLARRAIRAPRSDRTDFTMGPAAANRALTRLFAAEAAVVPVLSVPFGVSLLLVAGR